MEGWRDSCSLRRNCDRIIGTGQGGFAEAGHC
jgi:hypothetical protein